MCNKNFQQNTQKSHWSDFYCYLYTDYKEKEYFLSILFDVVFVVVVGGVDCVFLRFWHQIELNATICFNIRTFRIEHLFYSRF